MTALELKSIRVRLEGEDVLQGVNLSLHAGKVSAIIGPNGSGKSTTLSVAAGAIGPTEGEVRFAGKPLHKHSTAALARHRAVMPQDSAVAFPFAVREVVAMGRSAWRGFAQNEAIVERILDQTQLTEFADRDVTTLSGGERQRVAFARVLTQIAPSGEGTVLLLDEPTSAMDIAHSEALMTQARLTAHSGAAVGIVMHDLATAAAYADHVTLLSQGRVAAQGSVREVFTDAILSDVYETPIEVYERSGSLCVSPQRRVAQNHTDLGAQL